MVTLKTIAKQAGVSVTTISRILNSKDDRCVQASEETITRVRELAKKMNYVPNQMARTMKTSKSKCIGVVIPSFVDAFFCELYEEIRIYLEQKGYQTLLFFHDVGPNYMREVEQRELYERFNYFYIDALIFTYPDFHQEIERTDQIYEHRRPIVIVDYDKQPDELSPLNQVVINIQENCKKIIRYLFDRGIKDVCYLGPGVDDSDSRIVALKSIYREYNRPFRKEKQILNCSCCLSNGYDVTEQLIQSGDVPKGILCVNDNVAMGVIQCLWQNGYRIPEDVNVIGVNDTSDSRCIYPPLTTIRLPIKKIATALSDIVLNELQTEKRETTSVYINSELVIRNSTI